MDSEAINVPLVMRKWLQAQGVDCEAEGLRVVLDGRQATIVSTMQGQRQKTRVPFVVSYASVPASFDDAPPSRPPAPAKKKAAARPRRR